MSEKNSHFLKTTSNCSVHQTEVRTENGIQKGKMLTSNIFSNCKAFLLKSFNSQENSFSIQKNGFKPPFYYFDGGGECMLKKEEVQLPLKLLEESTAHPLRPYGRKGALLSVWWIRWAYSELPGRRCFGASPHKPPEPWPSLQWHFLHFWIIKLKMKTTQNILTYIFFM